MSLTSRLSLPPDIPKPLLAASFAPRLPPAFRTGNEVAAIVAKTTVTTTRIRAALWQDHIIAVTSLALDLFSKGIAILSSHLDLRF